MLTFFFLLIHLKRVSSLFIKKLFCSLWDFYQEILAFKYIIHIWSKIWSKGYIIMINFLIVKKKVTELIIQMTEIVTWMRGLFLRKIKKCVIRETNTTSTKGYILLILIEPLSRRDMAEILPTRRKTLSTQWTILM